MRATARRDEALSVMPQHAAERAEYFKKRCSRTCAVSGEEPGTGAMRRPPHVRVHVVSSYYRLEAERFDKVLER